MKPNSYNLFGEFGFSNCAVIVAHPDDETLWAGGTILMNPDVSWEIISLCRRSDPNRAPKFSKTVECYGAIGRMGDLDDGPEQKPLEIRMVENEIMGQLCTNGYDLIITHSLEGEYTRHRRHEEVGRAVVNLIKAGRLSADELWMFAYEDGGKRYLPKAIADADIFTVLSENVFNQKHKIITDIYGFDAESFEAKTAPRKEAFWRFKSVEEIEQHFNEGKTE